MMDTFIYYCGLYLSLLMLLPLYRAVFGPTVRGWNYDGLAVTSIAKVNFAAFASTSYGVLVAGGDDRRGQNAASRLAKRNGFAAERCCKVEDVAKGLVDGNHAPAS